MKPVSIGLVLLGGMLAAFGCAKKGEPPGGPQDTTPPYVESIYPDGGSVGVDRGSSISMTFSERMKKRTVETGVVVSPPCRWKKRYWDGLTYWLVPQSALKENATYLISLSNKAEDSHGVTMKSTFVSGFSTGDTLNAGLISGSIRWKNMDVEGAVVFLFGAVGADSAAGFPSAEPSYLTLSGSHGVFEIPFVDTGERYLVFAIIDKNLNSEYDEGENVGCHPGVLDFDDAPEIDGVGITICGERLLGGIVGRVDTSSVPDTLAITVTAVCLGDSALVYGARPKKDGSFEMGCVEPGLYRISAFNDVNANMKLEPGDSVLVEIPDTLKVDACAEPPEVQIGFRDED